MVGREAGAIGIAGGPIGPALRVGRQVDHLGEAARAFEQVRGAAVGEQHQRGAVLQHEAQPLGRIGRVQRHIGPARLQHRQNRHDHLEAALQAQSHPAVRHHAQRPQMMRQPVGPQVQLAIAQLPVLENQSNRIRTSAPPAPRTAHARTDARDTPQLPYQILPISDNVHRRCNIVHETTASVHRNRDACSLEPAGEG